MKNLYLKNLVFLLLISLSSSSQDGRFNFTISSPSITSAGVFKLDGTLVKTLWNNVRYESGTYTKFWDGKDDHGLSIASPNSSYQVKVVTNNVKYTWQGTIGNSSTSSTGDNKHRGYYACMSGLVFANNGYGYYCNGFSEGNPSYYKFRKETPQQKTDFYANYHGRIITLNTEFVATDNINVYWAGYDSYSINNSMVHAIRTSDDAEVRFSTGVPYSVTNGSITFQSVISKVNSLNSRITGLAVQKNGNFLFVARSGLNQLQVLNKTTGALVQMLSFSTPRGLNIDGNGNLWMISGTNTVAKYTVNANGTLSGSTLSLTGLLDPLAIQVSSDGSTITVADGSTSQQVKAFNNSTGLPSWVLGTAGGYFSDATVTNNKFYFNDVQGYNHKYRPVFLAFQEDGSFWVGDGGNFRAQHYSNNRTYIDRIMALGSTYTTWADRNNIKKVFAEYLEFEVDYSVQTLSGSNGWELKKNWGANVSSAYNNFQKIKYQTTLSNGRTYGFIRYIHNWEVVELPASGPLRFTGKHLNGLSGVLCSDGSLQDYKLSGSKATYNRYPLTGFDGANNPIWSSTGEILATATTDKNVGNPVENPISQVFSTTTNKVVLYNYKAYVNNSGPVFSKGYHLGLMQRGANDTYLFQTEKSTHRNYQGEFPQPGWFDEGNMVNDYAGGNVNIVDRNIITSYHGEFWKNAQTNKYNHYYDNGLAIGQFGTTRPETSGNAAAMMAGNALSPCVVKDNAGDLYLYHGDESDHSAVHRWKITGLNTIAEQSITVPFPTAYTLPVVNYVDLMAGLPFDATLVNNTAGWTRNPVNNNIVDPYASTWKAQTSALKYERESTNDLLIEFAQPGKQTYNVSRDLGTNNITNSWKISGNITFAVPGGALNGQNNNAYLEVLDVNGKVLTTFYALSNFLAYPIVVTKLYGNNSSIFSITYGNSVLSKTTPFEISVANGVANFLYSGYPPITTTISDVTGNWSKPKTLRIRFASSGVTPNYPVRYGLSDLKFYKDYSVAVLPNQAPNANAGTDMSITLPTAIATLNGSGTDTDGTISSYSWSKISGPAASVIVTPTLASTIVIGLSEGVYQYELTVTDDKGAIGKDTVKVTVYTQSGINLLPSVNPANAVNGLEYKYYEGNWNVLPVFSSLYPVKTGVTANFNLSLANRSTQYGFSFTGYINVPADGQYTFYTTSDDGSNLYIDNVLTVTNDGLHSPTEKSGIIGLKAGKHSITGLFFQQGWGTVFTVSYEGMGISKQTIPASALYRVNLAPKANAGTFQSISGSTNTVTLNGGGTDGDGTIISYSWAQISGPSNGWIETPDESETDVKNLINGVYQFELTVIDNDGAIGKDTVQVSVHAAAQKGRNASVTANNAPVAYAGSDITVTLPGSTVTLTGIGTDTDGSIQRYAWAKISGPTGDSIANPGEAITTVDNLVFGSYHYQLTVTDNNGSSSADSVWITVSSTTVNLNQMKSTAGVNYIIFAPEIADSLNSLESQKKTNPKISGINGFKVYPNPAKEIANLSITTILKNDQLSISVYNSTGMLVKSRQLNTPQLNTLYKLDMAGLNKGIYYIIIRFRDGQKISNKLLKE